MAWIRKGLFVINKPEQTLLTNFKSKLLFKVSYVAKKKDTWKWAGRIHQINYENSVVTVVGQPTDILINNQVLFVPQKFDNSYRIKFVKPKWIESLQIIIYESSDPMIFDICQILKNCQPSQPTNSFAVSGGGNFVPTNTVENISFSYYQNLL